MKVLAPSKDKVSKSLKRFGLTEEQVSKFLPRILLLLDWIGPEPKRVNSKLFRCFAEKIAVKKKTNLLTILMESKILRCTSKHIQNVRCREYRIKGPFIEHELDASENDLERLQKAQRMLEESNTSSTLEWLNRACQHRFYSGAYICNSIPDGWHPIGLKYSDAALLYSCIQKRIQHPKIYSDRFKYGILFQAMNYFYRTAPLYYNKPFSEHSIELIEHKRMTNHWRFKHEFLQKISSDRCELINDLVKELSATSTLVACDGCTLYSPDKERLQDAFCNWVLLRTSVNLKEEGNHSWVLCKQLTRKDIRNMVVPSINDAIEPLEKEIAFLHPELARRAATGLGYVTVTGCITS